MLNVSGLTNTYPQKAPKKTKVSVITRLTAHFMCGPASDPVISKHCNEYVFFMIVNVLIETMYN